MNNITAKNPQDIIERKPDAAQEIYNRLMGGEISPDDIIKTFKDIIKATKHIAFDGNLVEVPDHPTRHKGIVSMLEFLKLLKSPDDKPQGDTYVTQIINSFNLQDEKNLDESIEVIEDNIRRLRENTIDASSTN